MNLFYCMIKLLLCCTLYGQLLSSDTDYAANPPVEQKATNEIPQETTSENQQVTQEQPAAEQIPSVPEKQQPTLPVVPGNELVTPLVSQPQFSEVTVPVENKEEAKNIPSERAEEPLLEQPIIPTPIEHTEEETEPEIIHDAQLSGIDTSTLEEPQGNWLLKRMWYERAQDAYGKIKTLIDRIMDKRVEFFMKRGSLDKELFDVFYMEIGMGLGEFTTLMNDLTEEVEKERTQEQALSDEKQRILDNLTLEKTSIDHVKKHIETLKQIDQAIEQSLSTIIEIINSVRRYERDAWENFKEIGEVLSEKKARELFYKIDVALQNVKQIANYLDQAFTAYFENLETRARNSVEQIRKDLQNFKEKGLDLKASVERLRQEEIKVIEEEKEEEEEIVPKKPKTWWRSMVDTIKSFF